MVSSSSRLAPSSSKEHEDREPVIGTQDTGDLTMRGTNQAGPSIPIGRLNGSIPRILTRDETIAIFNKKKPPWEAKYMKPDTAASATTAGASPSASARAVQEDIVLSPWWAGSQTPKQPLPCIVQLGYLARMDSFYEDTKEWAFHLILDADQQQSPTMTMNSFSKRVQEQLNDQIERRLCDFTKDDWMVTDSKIQHVTDCFRKHRTFCLPKVLKACQTDEEKARLICISLVAWPKLRGHFDKCVGEPFSAEFTDRHPYDLRIWFLAPDNVQRFEMLTSLHSGLQKAHNVSLADGLKAQEETKSTPGMRVDTVST